MPDESADPLRRYKLSEWPFREVPERSRCTFIAGRPALSTRIDRMLASTGNSVSSIYLFWASLGAGKTHALYYLINRMDAPDRYLPIYSEYPEAPTGFVDIYEKLAKNIRWELVADFCFQLFAEAEGKTLDVLTQIKQVQPDIYRAFFLLAGDEDKAKARLASRWFRGEQLTRSELKDAALRGNLCSPGDCAGVISVLAKLLGLKRTAAGAGSPFRLVWVIDELQRLQNAPPRWKQEVNAALQSIFNSTPDYLTLILSFTGRPVEKLPDWIKPELADRIGARNTILLPPLTREEARTFLAELLARYRPDGQHSDRFFPFTDKAVEYMLARLMKANVNALGLGDLVEKEGIRPRALIKFCHAVLQEHIDTGAALPIEEKFVEGVIPRK